MADSQGLAQFPGVGAILSAEFTLSHGISPSVATVQILPQPSFTAEVGPLVFTFGGAPVVIFPDCKVDFMSFRRGGGGDTWTLAILDRRWKWAFGWISGTYNTRDDAGNLHKDRERTPAELATRCLTAMGESRFDVSQMPADPRPLIEWDWENPAQALASLCDQLGCRVVLRLDNSVLIARLGIGATLPEDAATLENSLNLNPPEKPQRLMVVGGKTRYQVDFRLYAVGKDTDGTIKAIDSLSYKPAGGWSNEFPEAGYWNVAEGEARELAKATVFRWYRIAATHGDGDDLVIPTYGKIEDGNTILPIEDKQVQTYAEAGVAPPDGATSPETPLPAEVFGTYYAAEYDFANSPANTPYLRSFRILHELGIVEFADYVWKFDAASDMEPATLRLRTAVSVRTDESWSWLRWTMTRQIGATPTEPRILKHDEIVKTVYVTYDGDTDKVLQVITNEDEIKKQAQHYLDAAQAEYQTLVPQELAYSGLRAINPDGAIQQVTWEVGPSGAFTRASRGNEFNLLVPSYEERRRLERARRDQVMEWENEIRKLRNQKRKDGAADAKGR